MLISCGILPLIGINLLILQQNNAELWVEYILTF